MIPVNTLLYKIDQRLNKLATNEHQEIPLEDKILALNEAQIKLIKTKVAGMSVPNRLGMDAYRKRYQDIENLVIDYKDNSLSLIETDTNLHQWDATIDKLDPKMMLFADAYLLADKGRCKNHIIWLNMELTKRGDVQFLMNNSHYKPSFEYQETFGSMSTGKMSVFTDGTFTPKKLHIMYIKYPAYIDKAGYVDFDGTASVTRDCELVEYLEDELLDLTVQNLADYTENMSANNSSRMRSQTNE